MIQHRELTTDERDFFAAARLRACTEMPYLASTLFRLRVLAAPDIGTFGVDRFWRLYVDPACFATWGVEICSGVLMHEAGHVLRGHAERSDNYGADQHARWNEAGDLEINDDLSDAGVTLPEGVLYPSLYGFPDNEMAEVYYDLLRQQEEERQGAPGGGQDGADDEQGEPGGDGSPADPSDSCGSGAGGPAAPWELDGADPRFSPASPAEAEMNRKIAAQEVAEHAAKNPGSVPAGLARWADRELTPSPTPWQKVLAGAIRSSVRYVAGAHDYTYSRRSRRSSKDFIFPGMHRPLPTVDVVVDTSGSVSPEGLAQATAEVKAIARRCGIEPASIRVLSVDTEVAGVSTGADLKHKGYAGGGGTDMTAGIAAAQSLRNPASCVVVLTDGYTPWPAAEGRSRLVVGLIGDDDGRRRALSSSPPPEWAKVVEIDLKSVPV